MENQENKTCGFAFWNVKGEAYRCKLKTVGIAELEDRYKKSLLAIISGSMPPLSTMLDIMHTAIKPWHHGIRLSDVYDMFDSYVEEGGSQIEFYTGPFMKMCRVSGFFPKKKAEDEETQPEEQESQPEN